MTSDRNNENGDGETAQVNESSCSRIAAKFEPIYIESQKNKTISQRKLANQSYVSSCSESSLSIENGNEKRNVELHNKGLSCEEMGLKEVNEKKDDAQEKSLRWSRSINREASNVSPFERHVHSNSVGSDVDTCSSAELPPEVLTNRIESLECQLAAIQLQLSTVLKSFESKSTVSSSFVCSYFSIVIFLIYSAVLFEVEEKIDKGAKSASSKFNSTE